MKAIFYFDYSDYRSYLMMHALDGLSDLGLDIRWRSVDAYSLRAMSGCSAPASVPAERNYLRREAERFCRMREIDFVWQSEPIHSGTALSAGIWFMTQAPESFEAYARCVLKNIWGLGNLPDAALIRSIFEALGMAPHAFFKNMSERACFQYQDACLQDALSAGVFDVPALVIGDALFLRYDQADAIRLEAIEQWLKSLPCGDVLKMAADLLSKLPRDAFARRFSATATGQTRGAPSVRQPVLLSADAVKLPVGQPKNKPRFAVPPMPEQIACHARAAHAPNGLCDVLREAEPGCVTVCITPNLILDESDLSRVKFEVFGERMIFAHICASQSGEAAGGAIVCIRIDEAGRCRVGRCGAEAPWARETFGNATIVALSPNASRDLLFARVANAVGAHIIMRCATEANAPIAEASACMASAWVFEFSQSGVDLIDAYAHRKRLSNNAELSLGESRRHNAEPWSAPAPRTLLLLEKALAFGDIGSGADIELACRGRDLTIVTANQESNISHARDYVSVRIAEKTFDIIPIAGAEIYTFETLLCRTVCTINRAPKKSCPLCVNYWTDLEYEMLDVIRPMLAAMAAQLRIPMLLAVSNQLVEIWLVTAGGAPYRLEKNGDAFQADAADLALTDDLLGQILAALDISPQMLTQRIASFDEAKF